MEVEDCTPTTPIGSLPDQSGHQVDVGGLTGGRLDPRECELSRLVAVQEVRTPGGHPPIVPT